MTHPYLAHVIQQTQPPDNDLRTGTVVANDGGSLRVDINGGVVDCGFLRSYEPFSGDTVAVLRQESGWLVLGSINGPAAPAGVDAVAASGVVGAAYFTGGTAVVSVGAAEAIIPAWTVDDDFAFLPGQIYRVDMAFGFYDTAGFSHLCDFRVRKGISTAGQLLGSVRRATVPNMGSQVQMGNASVFVKNATGTAIVTPLGLSIARIAVGGTPGNVGLYGDATYVMSLTLEHVGQISALPTLAAAAGSIT